MSAVEYAEWLAYYEVEPFGPEAEELRMARLMALLAEINRDEKKRKDPFTADDFMLESMKPCPVEDDKRTEEDEIALAKKIAGVFGLKIPGV